MIEEWKICAGTECRYSVSNLGRVMRSDGVVLTITMPKNERTYPSVMLRHGGARRRVSIHRLVAINFLPLPPVASCEVRHLDGDHLNYSLSNLAWGTPKDNAADRDAHGRTARGQSHGMTGRKLSGPANGNYSVTPEIKDRVAELVASGLSQRQAGASVGISQKSVWKALRALRAGAKP